MTFRRLWLDDAGVRSFGLEPRLHKCGIYGGPTLTCDVPKTVHELYRLLADVPARLNRKRHKPECSMIRNIECVLGLYVCENCDGWLGAWGLCGYMLSRFSTVWLLPFTLL